MAFRRRCISDEGAISDDSFIALSLWLFDARSTGQLETDSTNAFDKQLGSIPTVQLRNPGEVNELSNIILPQLKGGNAEARETIRELTRVQPMKSGLTKVCALWWLICALNPKPSRLAELLDLVINLEIWLKFASPATEQEARDRFLAILCLQWGRQCLIRQRGQNLDTRMETKPWLAHPGIIGSGQEYVLTFIQFSEQGTLLRLNWSHSQSPQIIQNCLQFESGPQVLWIRQGGPYWERLNPPSLHERIQSLSCPKCSDEYRSGSYDKGQIHGCNLRHAQRLFQMLTPEVTKAGKGIVACHTVGLDGNRNSICDGENRIGDK